MTGSAVNAAAPGRPSGRLVTRVHVPPSYVAGFAMARVPGVQGARLDSKSKTASDSADPRPLQSGGGFGCRIGVNGQTVASRSSTAAMALATAAQSPAVITSLDVVHVAGPV